MSLLHLNLKGRKPKTDRRKPKKKRVIDCRPVDPMKGWAKPVYDHTWEGAYDG